MSERTRDERIEDYYRQSARELAQSLVDAEDETARLRSAWRSARGRAAMYFRGWRGARWRAGLYQEEARKDGAALREMLGVLGIRSSEGRRYRTAWLSARRRAADAYNHGVEAMDLIHARAARRIKRGDDFSDEMIRLLNRGETPSAVFLTGALDELHAAIREEREYVPRDSRKSTYAGPPLRVHGGTVWRLENGSLVRYPTDEP
nr:hypothetical protein OG513_07690 [Streptomyces sp. NBC_00998]